MVAADSLNPLSNVSSSNRECSENLSSIGAQESSQITEEKCPEGKPGTEIMDVFDVVIGFFPLGPGLDAPELFLSRQLFIYQVVHEPT